MKSVKRKTTTTTTIQLAGKDVIDLLRQSGESIPHNASVTFRVPSGGDYSGETLDVDSRNVITVTYVEESEA